MDSTSRKKRSLSPDVPENNSSTVPTAVVSPEPQRKRHVSWYERTRNRVKRLKAKLQDIDAKLADDRKRLQLLHVISSGNAKPI